MAFFFIGCNQENALVDNGELPKTETSASEGIMKLGKQLENPYSIENMKRAISELYPTRSAVELEPTHLYVRFLPATEEEMHILRSDSTLDLSLDYEIEKPGNYYHDHTLPEDAITWQYVVVKPDYDFPNIKYEILSELFILDEDKDDDEAETRSSKITFIDWENLENKALEITGNLDDESSDETLTRASKWTPSGKISAWDSSLRKYVGVEGIEVRAKRWFTTHKGFTNSNGDFRCNGKFKRNANYSLRWERYNFEIRRASSATAILYGPKKRGEWNESINNNDPISLFNATIFRAAYHYYYKDIKGLRRPPQNSFWKTQLKIRAYYETNYNANGNHEAWRRFLGLGSAIKIYNPHRASQDTYGTVIHELAHASHWSMGSSTFNDARIIMKESWARGVQWELTKMVYPTYKGGGTKSPYYTQLVVDMIDSNFSDTNYGKWDDNVSGYTIKQIEDALRGQKTWNDWKNNIKNKYNNETEKHLDALFEHWDNI